MEAVLAPFPKVRVWMRRVSTATAPHYEQVGASTRPPAARARQLRVVQRSKRACRTGQERLRLQ